MEIVGKIDRALRQIEALPLNDEELLSMPLYLQILGISPKETSPICYGELLQKILFERQKKGIGHNRELLLALLSSWNAPLTPALSEKARSTFFLGSGL